MSHLCKFYIFKHLIVQEKRNFNICFVYFFFPLTSCVFFFRTQPRDYEVWRATCNHLDSFFFFFFCWGYKTKPKGYKTLIYANIYEFSIPYALHTRLQGLNLEVMKLKHDLFVMMEYLKSRIRKSMFDDVCIQYSL